MSSLIKLLKISGVIQHQVYQSWVHSIDNLNRRLLGFCHGIGQAIIDNAIDEWCGRLRVRGQAKDGLSTTVVTIFNQERFQFLSNMTQFLDFFNKLSQIQTYKFCTKYCGDILKLW